MKAVSNFLLRALKYIGMLLLKTVVGVVGLVVFCTILSYGNFWLQTSGKQEYLKTKAQIAQEFREMDSFYKQK